MKYVSKKNKYFKNINYINISHNLGYMHHKMFVSARCGETDRQSHFEPDGRWLDINAAARYNSVLEGGPNGPQGRLLHSRSISSHCLSRTVRYKIQNYMKSLIENHSLTL